MTKPTSLTKFVRAWEQLALTAQDTVTDAVTDAVPVAIVRTGVVIAPEGVWLDD